MSAGHEDMPDAPVSLRPEGRPGEIPRLTRFPPEGRGPFPAMVVIPGGGYGGVSGYGPDVARWLKTLGFTSFVLEYHTAPHRHPLPLREVTRAIRLVRAESDRWRVDPGRVGVMGFSAGGHVAACASTIFDPARPDAEDPVERESSRPDFAVLSYPVITFGEHRHHGSMVNLLGEDAPDELRRDLSLENRVSHRTPPTLLWHTADDAVVPVENSLLYAEALSAHGVPFELHVFPHGPHGACLCRDCPELVVWKDLMIAWLRAGGILR